MKKNETTFWLIKSSLLTLFSTLMISFLFIGCSSEDDSKSDDPNDPIIEKTFKASDFEVYDVVYDPTGSSQPNEIFHNFKVKNISNKTYNNTTQEGHFYVLLEIKGSDGAWYEREIGINKLNAGASQGENGIGIFAPQGIALELSTFKYSVTLQD